MSQHGHRVSRRCHGGSGLSTLATGMQYIVRFTNFSAIPSHLRKEVRETVNKAFDGVFRRVGLNRLVFDFDARQAQRNSLVTYDLEILMPGPWGLTSGELTDVYLALMQGAMIETSPGNCEPLFANDDGSLGSMIANTTAHEIGHNLGLTDGGIDGYGHSGDPDNYLWAAKAGHYGQFEYTVQSGDTLSGIVARFNRGELHPCLPTTQLTYPQVWKYGDNKKPGYVADPNKGDIPGRIAGDMNWIYPGEKVAFPDNPYRLREYKRHLPGWIGEKTFTGAQVDDMSALVLRCLAHPGLRPSEP